MHRSKCLNDTGVDNLVQGIVVRAVDDWRQSRKILRRHEIAEYRELMEDCEKFFLSGWFELLTGFKGSIFMQDLKRLEEKQLCG